MAKLKDWLLNYSARQIASKHRLDDSTEELRAKDLNFLSDLLAERNDQIARLKATDKNREAIHTQLKIKYEAKQKECTSLRRRFKTFRHLLRKRGRHLIRLRSSFRGWQQAGVHHNLHILKDAPPPPEEKFPLFSWLSLNWNSFDGFIWSHWMRLGVLEQHTPLPVSEDKALAKRVQRVRLTVRPEAMPSIGIVTPSFNQAEFLPATMRSVLDQGYPNLDYVVMDGGSQDGSAALIEAEAGKLKFWQSKPDGGQAAAIRAGFEKSGSEIMGWLNSDDALMPGTLHFIGDMFRSNPEIDVIYGHRLIINAGGNAVGRWVLPRHDGELLLYADFIPQETCFWRRTLYDKVGGIDSSFHFAMDWDLFLRFQNASARFYRAPYFLGLFRIHSAQKSTSELDQHGYPEMKKLRHRELGEHYSRYGLERNVSRGQLAALTSLMLMRAGIRF